MSGRVRVPDLLYPRRTAPDVVQEGFLRLHRAREGGERIESPRLPVDGERVREDQEREQPCREDLRRYRVRVRRDHAPERPDRASAGVGRYAALRAGSADPAATTTKRSATTMAALLRLRRGAPGGWKRRRAAGALYGERQVLGQARDLISGPANAYEPPARIDALHKDGRDDGATNAYEAADTEDEIIRLGTVGREERCLYFSHRTVARFDGVAVAGSQCLPVAGSQRSSHALHRRRSI